MILDDDMIFSDRTDPIGMLHQAKTIAGFDIFCGSCQGHERHDFGVFSRWNKDGKRYLRLDFKKCSRRHCDHLEIHYGVNFFVARTESVRRMGGWPYQIKIGREHVVFFAMAWDAGLDIRFSGSFKINHQHAKYERNRSFRRRTAQYDQIALDLMKCDQIVALWPNKRAKFGWRRKQ